MLFETETEDIFEMLLCSVPRLLTKLEAVSLMLTELTWELAKVDVRELELTPETDKLYEPLILLREVASAISCD